KQAILYEVIAEDTSEEKTSARRRGENNSREEKPQKANLQVIYSSEKKSDLKAAEQLEINYSTQKKDVTNRTTDTPPKRRGNYPKKTET
ncbi:ATP-dependent helicase, partial [Dolichospermum sp. ST_sed10]|nr:ATP-dependent helicase [Dolichospermum sp. ST_sed10]